MTSFHDVVGLSKISLHAMKTIKRTHYENFVTTKQICHLTHNLICHVKKKYFILFYIFTTQQLVLIL